VLGDHVDQVRLHDLGDHRQAGGLARLGQVLQPLQPQALEAIRARARLECPPRRMVAPALATAVAVSSIISRFSTEQGPAMIVSVPLPILVPRTSMTVSSGWIPRRQLVGATDLRHRLDSAHRIQLAHQMLSYGSHVTQYRDHHTLGADIVVRAQPVGSNLSPDCFGFLVCRAADITMINWRSSWLANRRLARGLPSGSGRRSRGPGRATKKQRRCLCLHPARSAIPGLGSGNGHAG